MSLSGTQQGRRQEFEEGGAELKGCEAPGFWCFAQSAENFRLPETTPPN